MMRHELSDPEEERKRIRRLRNWKRFNKARKNLTDEEMNTINEQLEWDFDTRARADYRMAFLQGVRRDRKEIEMKVRIMQDCFDRERDMQDKLIKELKEQIHFNEVFRHMEQNLDWTKVPST